jgi:sulfite reductase beta subunit-like hemoprotein
MAEVARQFSLGQLRVSIGQNLYLPWVREEKLADLHAALKQIELGESGVGTVTDVTTCPGADTCRLGIASAKGLGAAISEGFNGPLAQYRELARDLKIKISGCPNGCAQHGIADIGFHAARAHEALGKQCQLINCFSAGAPILRHRTSLVWSESFQRSIP